jgi:phi13 family phage major tail protein
MATTGIKHPVFAPITARNTGAKPTYGTGVLLGKATKADITINTAEGKLYADDALAEYDSKFQSGSVSLGVDELTPAKKAALFGYTIDSSSGKQILKKGASDVAPHGGFGYYKTKKIDGARKYEVKWMYDVVFRETNDNAETANENVNFQTSEIAGEILPIIGLGNDDWSEEQICDTEQAAITALHTYANISGTPSLRSGSAPSNTKGGSSTTESGK